MKNLFKKHAISIRIYMGKTTVTDPFTKATSITMLSPIPIKALVNEVAPEKTRWVLPGIETTKAQQLIIEKRNLKLIEQSVRIQILGENYLGYKDNSDSFYIQDMGDKYVKVYTIKE